MVVARVPQRPTAKIGTSKIGSKPVKGNAGTQAGKAIKKVTRGKGNPTIAAINKTIKGKTRGTATRNTGTVKGGSGSGSPY